ncbi:MAG TPA: four helix bundle protein [Planctomycetota bacterium]|nr:four helix bundle protein [Planctomycetota bacterium]
MTGGAEGEAKTFDLEERLIRFAVRVMHVVDQLPATRAGRHIAGQLIECGTSPAPNYGEAQDAESRSDFVHKVKVALKEFRETRVWLRMIRLAELLKPPRLDPLLEENEQLIKILCKSTRTAKKNQQAARNRRSP